MIAVIEVGLDSARLIALETHRFIPPTIFDQIFVGVVHLPEYDPVAAEGSSHQRRNPLLVTQAERSFQQIAHLVAYRLLLGQHERRQ